MCMCRNVFGRALLCLGAVLFILTAANAQNAPVQARASDPPAESGGLQQVTVTAERITELEQKTPVSMNIYNTADIAREGIVDMQSLAQIDTSLQFNRNGGNGLLTIRGVSTNNTTEVGNPSVPVSVDDFVINRPTELDATLFDVAQIEVLRGPQGTLFGRSASGGIVNVTTVRPSNTFSVSGALEYGNYDTLNIDGSINVPINDSLQVRAAMFTRVHSGYRVGPQFWRHYEQFGKWHFFYDLPGGMTLSYLGGVDYYERHELDSGDPPWPPAFNDPAALGPWMVNGYRNNEKPTTQNHELRLTSSDTGPLTWQGGLYYFIENNSLYNGVIFNADSIFATPDRTYQYQIHTTSQAAYAQGNYAITSKQQFSVGVRYSEDDLH